MEDLAHGWRRSRSVHEWLTDEPYKFEFYQAVRLLEAFHPKALLSGDRQQVLKESVRFRSAVNFDFPASEIQQLEWTNNIPRVTVNFFGLAGALGPLPQAYTEMVLDAVAKKDPAAIDFLDIFNNRLITLLYRVRQVHQPALTARSPDKSGTAGHLFACIGLGTDLLRQSVGFPARSLLEYGGLFPRPVRTAAGLEVLLSHHFSVPVRVHQFEGIWREIDRSQWTTIGSSGQNNALGTQTALGKRAWDQAGCLVITAGPLHFNLFSKFLPGSRRYDFLSRLLKFSLGIGVKLKMRLILESTSVPHSKLGQSRLGLTSWLLGRSKAKTDQQITFHLLT